MNRLTLRLTAAVLTFLVGVASVSVWLIARRHPVMNNANAPTKASPPARVKRTYRDVDHASVRVRDGGYAASVSTVESSDGRTFTSIIAVLPSDKKAQEEMDRILQRASEIIRREPLYNEDGGRVREKAIATFTANASAPAGSAELLWIRGAEFNRITASSLQNILEYEQDHEW